MTRKEFIEKGLALGIIIFMYFGPMHVQQGLTSQFVAGSTGAILSSIFYKRNFDLWFMVIIHGVFNTFGILSFYLGIA